MIENEKLDEEAEEIRRETADGAPPHAATGCPFQAWSVAEALRVRRAMADEKTAARALVGSVARSTAGRSASRRG